MDCPRLTWPIHYNEGFNQQEYFKKNQLVFMLVDKGPNLPTGTDYKRPESNQASLLGQKFNPNPKCLVTAEAYCLPHGLLENSLHCTAENSHPLPNF